MLDNDECYGGKSSREVLMGGVIVRKIVEGKCDLSDDIRQWPLQVPGGRASQAEG